MTGNMKPPAVLIAPLGSEPQLVTLVIDLLLERDAALEEVIVIHTCPRRPTARGREAMAALGAEFALTYPFLRLRPICLCDEQAEPYEDLETEAASRDAFRVLYQEIRDSKRGGWRVHLSTAGGRKVLAVYGVAAAQLLFDEGDVAWHLVSAPDLMKSGSLHALPGETQLVPIPVLRWSQIGPALTELGGIDDPFEAVLAQERLQRAVALRQAGMFVEQALTPAERDVVQLAVLEGMTNAEIGERLHKSPRTVGHQLSAAYRKLRGYFGLAAADRVTLTSVLEGVFREGVG
jgi:CRISPR-associated protein Csx14